MDHKVYRSKYGETHYWISAKKPNCIVFTHGALMDHHLFEYQIKFFAPDYTVLTWDVPAHGRSRPFIPFSLQNASNELLHILNREGISQTHLVGQSMGGYISQIFARGYPDKVKSLTAIGSSPIQPKYYSITDNWLLSTTPIILQLYPYSHLIKTIAKQISVNKDGQSYALKTLKQYSKSEIVEVMKEVYLGVKDYRENDALNVPILITYGSEDKTGKVQTYSQRWSKSENRPLQVIPNAAHNANMDNPDSFNEILLSFLEK